MGLLSLIKGDYSNLKHFKKGNCTVHIKNSSNNFTKFFKIHEMYVAAKV